METVRPDDDFDYRPSLLQFCLSNPLVDVVLTGMRTVNEVEQNVAVANDLAGRIDLKAIHEHYPAK
jgi:aryl-alcohol dehydrogenase-like predicted oxidoreductase